MTKGAKLRSAILVLFLLGSVLFAQEMMVPPMAEINFTHRAASTTIPIDISDGHVAFHVKINGKYDARIVLDTGFPNPGIFLHKNPAVDALDLPVMGAAMVGGAGGNFSEAVFTEPVNITLPDLEINGLATVIMDLDPIKKEKFGMYDGVMGFDMLKDLVVSLDFEKMKMTLTKPSEFKFSKKAEVFPLRFTMNMPAIDVPVIYMDKSKDNLKTVIDLGASTSFVVDTELTPNAVIPDETLSKDLYGMGGKTEMKIGRINEIQLGRFHLDNVITNYGPMKIGAEGMNDHANLGLGILKRFHVHFDYPNARMILEPNKYYRDPFEYDMSGLTLSVTGNNEFKVDDVEPGSPAETAGMKKGDLIYSINEKPARKYDMSDLWRLFTQDGKQVRLRVKRAGEANSLYFINLKRII